MVRLKSGEGQEGQGQENHNFKESSIIVKYTQEVHQSQGNQGELPGLKMILTIVRESNLVFSRSTFKQTLTIPHPVLLLDRVT